MTGSGIRPVQVGDLRAQVRGMGPGVLLIHGNDGDRHFFDLLAPGLAAHFTVTAMDCRGQGESERGAGPLTIHRMAEDAADVIRAVHPGERVSVVGFSDGANIAMVLAARHPALVDALVLNSGNFTAGGLRLMARAHLRVAIGLLALRRPSPAVIRQRELTRLMLDAPGISPDDLAGIAVPTLVLAGAHDLIWRAHTRRIARLIPGAQLRIIRGGTHSVLRIMPDVANRIVEDFLRTGTAPLDGRWIAER